MHNQSPEEGWFTTTHWSVVLNAQEASNPKAMEALELLCRTYWYPIYAYIRSKGRGVEAAQDLTQVFFAKILEKNLVELADPAKGKFRSFLLGVLENLLADNWARSHRQKRGSGRSLISLDAEEAESRYQLEPIDELTPEKIFDRRWALTLIDHAMNRLREECSTGGRSRLFEKVEAILSGDREGFSYAVVAEELKSREGALRTAVHRLRQRLGELIREEIAQTVAGPEEVEEELQHLFSALRL